MLSLREQNIYIKHHVSHSIVVLIYVLPKSRKSCSFPFYLNFTWKIYTTESTNQMFVFLSCTVCIFNTRLFHSESKRPKIQEKPVKTACQLPATLPGWLQLLTRAPLGISWAHSHGAYIRHRQTRRHTGRLI